MISWGDHTIIERCDPARGWEFVCELPRGWDWRLLPGGKILAVHPDYAPRIWQGGKWTEVGL